MGKVIVIKQAAGCYAVFFAPTGFVAVASASAAVKTANNLFAATRLSRAAAISSPSVKAATAASAARAFSARVFASSLFAGVGADGATTGRLAVSVCAVVGCAAFFAGCAAFFAATPAFIAADFSAAFLFFGK